MRCPQLSSHKQQERRRFLSSVAEQQCVVLREARFIYKNAFHRVHTFRSHIATTGQECQVGAEVDPRHSVALLAGEQVEHNRLNRLWFINSALCLVSIGITRSSACLQGLPIAASESSAGQCDGDRQSNSVRPALFWDAQQSRIQI